MAILRKVAFALAAASFIFCSSVVVFAVIDDYFVESVQKSTGTFAFFGIWSHMDSVTHEKVQHDFDPLSPTCLWLEDCENLRVFNIAVAALFAVLLIGNLALAFVSIIEMFRKKTLSKILLRATPVLLALVAFVLALVFAFGSFKKLGEQTTYEHNLALSFYSLILIFCCDLFGSLNFYFVD